MLKNIQAFFQSKINLGNEALEADKDHGIQLATAAILIELIYADTEIDSEEWGSVENTLTETFNLDQTELNELLTLAELSRKDSTDLYQFTRLINQHYEYQDKCTLLECMWRVAHADGRVDRFEEHLIRKIAGLIHVSHGDFIQAKQKGRN